MIEAFYTLHGLLRLHRVDRRCLALARRDGLGAGRDWIYHCYMTEGLINVACSDTAVRVSLCRIMTIALELRLEAT